MKVQEALKSAETFIGELPFSLQRDIELRRIGEALADIEKCEPVLKVYQGEICYKSQADDQSYGMWCPVNFDTAHTFKEGTQFYTSPQPIEKCEPVGYVSALPIKTPQSIRSDANDVFKYAVYTSPISKEWVGLTDMQITNIGMQHQSLHQVAYAISDELKQLNAEKG